MDASVGSASELLAKQGLNIIGLRSDLAGPFDLTVPQGSVICISGASGSGKSLFLRMVADLDANEGRVELRGQARDQMSAPDWRRRVSYVAAESGWWRDTVEAHFPPHLRGAAVGLAEKLGVGMAQCEGLVARLSTGERQRLALVRALVLDSAVLLLDEPTGALDPASVAAVEAILAERLRDGTIVLMVSHDALQGQRLGAKLYSMVDRRLAPQA